MQATLDSLRHHARGAFIDDDGHVNIERYFRGTGMHFEPTMLLINVKPDPSRPETRDKIYCLAFMAPCSQLQGEHGEKVKLSE